MKPGAIDIIVGGLLGKKKDHKKDPTEDDEEESMDESIGLESAAEEIMDAINAGDSKALMKALKAFMEMC